MSEIQAVLFDRKKFTPAKARIWLYDYQFVPLKPFHITKNKIRSRIQDPTQFKRMRIKRTHDPGVEFVVGFR